VVKSHGHERRGKVGTWRKHPAKAAGALTCSRSGATARSGGLVGGPALPRGLASPRQQRIDLLGGMIGDAGEHVGEPRLGIDAGEFAALDQRVSNGRTVAARVGAAEGPISSANRYTA
jgi:hypothetical protein